MATHFMREKNGGLLVDQWSRVLQISADDFLTLLSLPDKPTILQRQGSDLYFSVINGWAIYTAIYLDEELGVLTALLIDCCWQPWGLASASRPS